MTNFVQTIEDRRVHGMARILLLFSEWHRAAGSASIAFERIVLIDFAAQYPRFSGSLVPGVARVARANGIEDLDLGDLFARRNFEFAREQTQGILVGLTARALVDELLDRDVSGGAFTLSDSGHKIAMRFSSPLSWIFRSMYRELISAWRRTATDRIEAQLRDVLPETAVEIAAFSKPFDVDQEEVWAND